MYEYEFTFSANICNLLPRVADFCDAVNTTMADFGFPEKLTIRSEILTAKLSGVRKLTAAEQASVANILLVSLRDKFPNYEFEFEGCLRLPRIIGSDDELSDD